MKNTTLNFASLLLSFTATAILTLDAKCMIAGPFDIWNVAITRAAPLSLAPEAINYAGLEVGDEVQLNLFADTIYGAHLVNKSTNVNGTQSLTYKLDDFQFAYGHVTITGEKVQVTIDVPELGANYASRLHPITGTAYLLQLDPTKLDQMDESVDLRNHQNPAAKHASRKNPDLSPPSQNGVLATQVDVMIVYTAAAQNWATANEGSIDNTIAQAVSRANLVASNTSVGFTFNLVYSGLVTYNESGSSLTDIERLREDGDGFLDEVHTIRDQVGADMVAIFTQANDTGGLGYYMWDRFGDTTTPFSMNRVQQISWTYTLVHEWGHNMGLGHSKFQDFQAGPAEWANWPENTWSAGWRWQGNTGYHTDVMAYSSGSYYPDGNDAPNLPYFSDPTITLDGQPAGHVLDGDAARTLRITGPIIALYRTAPGSASVSQTFVYHAGSSFASGGVSAALDTAKTLAKEGVAPIPLSYNNLINSSRGINGVVFDIEDLPTASLTASDFTFQWSPQGIFNPGANPPAGWSPAAQPTSVQTTPGSVSRVVLQWADGAIANRWLRITVLANANTGLAQPETYYLGHLLGETTGIESGAYSVAFADIAPIRNATGQAAGVGSIFDVDKNGSVTFSDISAMRPNIGGQLTTITIPAQ